MTNIIKVYEPETDAPAVSGIEPLAVPFSCIVNLPLGAVDMGHTITLVFEQQKKLATAHGALRFSSADNTRQLAKSIIAEFFAGRDDYSIKPEITAWDNGRRQCYRVELTRQAGEAITDLPDSLQLPQLAALGTRVVHRLAAEFIPFYR